MTTQQAFDHWLEHRNDPPTTKKRMNEKEIIESVLLCLRVGLRNAERVGDPVIVGGYNEQIEKYESELKSLTVNTK